MLIMTKIIYWSVFILLVIPKINLISVGNYNAGLRIDDLIISFLAAIFIINFSFLRKKSIPKPYVRYYLFIIFILFGTLITSVAYNLGSIIFPLRFLEYFTFFVIGVKLGSKGEYISGMMKFLLYSNILISVLQFLDIIGGFSTTGYRPSVSDRVIGLCSGPWELGVILNFLTCYFLGSRSSMNFKYLVFFSSLIIIFLSGSRMSLVAQVLIMIYYIYKSSSIVGIMKKVIILLPFVLLAVYFFSDSTVASRSGNLFTMDNITSIPDTYRATVLLNGNPDWSKFGVLGGDDVDASWAIRSLKWIYAVKLYLSNSTFFFTGVGAGTFGNALDGGWLRIFTECGIFGFSVFMLFIMHNTKKSIINKMIFISFSVNMLMIDIFMSYKVMSLMLFIFGYIYSDAKNDKSMLYNRTIKFK